MAIESKIDILKRMVKEGGIKRLLRYTRKQDGELLFCIALTGKNGEQLRLDYRTIEKRKEVEKWLSNAQNASKTPAT